MSTMQTKKADINNKRKGADYRKSFNQSVNRKNSLIIFFRNYAPLLIILVVASLFFLPRLGRNILIDWDECIYAQYAKEMPLTGHYLTNIWNGYIDMQKPPLYSWTLMTISRVFSPSEFYLRLLSTLSGLAIIASVYMFCLKHFSRFTAITASLLLLVAELFVILSLRINTDMSYSLFIFLGFLAWIKSYTKPRMAYLSGLLFAISTLLKGLGTMQIMGALFLTLLIQPSRTDFLRYVRMIVIYFIVIIPWHIIAYLTYGAHFIHVYFYESIIQRGKYPMEFHRERWWYYFVLLYRELKPWLAAGVIFPTLLTVFIIKAKSASKILKVIQDERIIISVLIMILIPLASFVKFQTRVAWYIIPIYPFIAIYLAYNLEKIVSLCTYCFKSTSLRNKITIILYSIIILLISGDAFRLLMQEIKPFQSNRELSPRDSIIQKTRNYPQKELHYLVPSWERQAKEILPPTEQLDMTFVFGGNPCAVYYSDKKVYYYYSVDDFKKNLGTSQVLYLSHISDKDSLVGTKPITEFENAEFMLFSYE